VGARGNGAGDLGEVQVHRPGIGERQHQRGAGAAGRTGRAEEVGPLFAGVADHARQGAAPGPDSGEGALLADARLVLDPDLERLVAGLLRQRRRYRVAEVF
jgi:hypothetical protein